MIRQFKLFSMSVLLLLNCVFCGDESQKKKTNEPQSNTPQKPPVSDPKPTVNKPKSSPTVNKPKSSIDKSNKKNLNDYQRLIEGLENNPYNHLVTMNSHGGFSPNKIILPEGVYVLIPHAQGLDVPYTTPDVEFENGLYMDPKNPKLPDFKDENNQPTGWKLYKPGDKINNMSYSTLHTIKPHALADGVSKFIHGKGYTKDPNKKEEVEKRQKILVFKNCNLEQVSQSLSEKAKKDNQPKILIPLACNASSASNITLQNPGASDFIVDVKEFIKKEQP